MGWYGVEFDCPSCGRVHTLSNQAQIPAGSIEAGTLAELYPDGVLHWAVVWMMESKIWCDEAGEYVEVDDPARVRVSPWL